MRNISEKVVKEIKTRTYYSTTLCENRSV